MNNHAPQKSTGRSLRLLVLLASLALFASACSKATNNANTSSSNTSSTSSSSTSSTSSTASTAMASSPIAAYKAFQDANKKKDYEGVKKRFSRASIAILTDEAKKKNQTLDEFVKQQVDTGSNDEEVTNEKINGDSATVDLKDKNSSITLPLVKEDGEWKIAYDVFMKQMTEAFDKMSKEAEKSTSGSDDNSNK